MIENENKERENGFSYLEEKREIGFEIRVWKMGTMEEESVAPRKWDYKVRGVAVAYCVVKSSCPFVSSQCSIRF